MMANARRPAAAIRPSSLAIDNLRAIVILLVLAFHSMLAYLSFLPPHPFGFADPPYLWRAFPIVDAQRWVGFDVFCAWVDVFLMSLFFLVSGLFVWPSLSRKGVRRFLGGRLLRLGLPFAAVVLLLMPAAHYPTYLQSADGLGISAFWREWLDLPLWPAGPMWFLWLLLVCDLAAAAVYGVLAGRHDWVQRLSVFARRHPREFLAGFVATSALAYIPMALLFGSGDWFQRGPLSFQLSRPLHYLLYFLAGAAIGACGIEGGLLAVDGPLARHWRGWSRAAPLAFAMWLALTSLTNGEGAAASFLLAALDHLSYVLACFASCCMTLALAVRFGAVRVAMLDSLKANAYGMYLIHYFFVVWLQFALLGIAVPAVVKASLVFGGTLLLSWSITAGLRRVPLIAQVIGGERNGATAAAVPTAATGLAD